ncbi:hypothetical protein [Flavobacterium gilvum]|uniref:DUF3999 family protein n=1 Tax=Flavobacterium gilvum TaxID=1492737 RepID=A0AAC9I3A0_9FLAO|nr:hypothetical protein [Flavobacterium gilvum]AOW09481.1 hypothetical protein EM308_08200 [Flavobacterium gilvum]KFC60838.1 hypothetical protein FEM08_03970 [Flavobacterium gilvum]
MKQNQALPMRYNKFILLFFWANLTIAQNTTAKIQAVPQNGLHKIVLPPAIRSFSKQDVSDFRIFDSKENEVPYFLVQNENETITNDFDEYKITSKTVLPKKSTSVIIENPSPKNYSQISLYIANSNVVKEYSISGSNDQTEWFGLSNNQELSDLTSISETYVVKTISLPLSSYKFLKIDLNDKKTLPINILKAGNFKSHIQNNSLLEIIPKEFSVAQIPAKKETIIRIVFDAPQIINQLVFEISKPNFYTRNTTLFKNEAIKVKHKTKILPTTITNFELNSKTKNTFNIPEIFEKEIFIKIENQDNQSLTITSVKCMQIPVSIIADLNANTEYTVKTGNPKLSSPQYDLSNFKKNISVNLPETTIYDIKKNILKENNDTVKSFWQQAWFMWVCIVLGGIAIFYFTTSLIKDMKTE